MNDSVNPIRQVVWADQGRGVLLAQAAGEVDLRHAEAFQQSLLSLVERGPKVLVVDLTEVPFMDSSGLASLIKCLLRSGQRGVSLRLCGLNPRVSSVMEISRLDKAFSIFPGRQEAIGA